jgi:hypothetical protein
MYHGDAMADGCSPPATLKKVIFHFDAPLTGLYDVVVWFPADSNRAADVPLTIDASDGSTKTARYSQEAPNGAHSEGEYVKVMDVMVSFSEQAFLLPIV